MIIYCIWELLSFISYNTRINKQQVTGLLFFLLWILMAFRSWNMGLNDTSGTYYIAFQTCCNVSCIEALRLNVFINEPLMTVYTWLIAKLFGNYQVFLAISCSIPLIAIYRYVKDNTNDPLFGTIVFFSFFFFYESYLIKQMLACSIILLSLKYLHSRDLKKYLLLILVAGLFHKSAFVLVLLYPLCKSLKFNKYFFAFVIASIIIGVTCGNMILNLLYKVKLYNFELYIRDGIYKTNGDINFSMFLYPFLSGICYIFRDKSECINKQNDLFLIVLIGCILNSWSTVIVEFYRIAIYFFLPFCILVPNTFKNIPKKYRNIFKLGLMCFLYLYAFKIAANTNCLNYQFFFSI